MTDARDHRPPPPRGVPPRSGRSKALRRLVAGAWLVTGLILVALALDFPGSRSQQVPFSRVLQLTDEGRVAKAIIAQQAIEAELKGSGNQPGETVRSAVPANYETNDLVERLRKSGAEVDARPPSPWSAALAGLLPFLLIGAFWYFVVLRRARQQLGGSPLSFGRNRAKLYDRADMKTTFADVAGVDEVEAELTELVDYLRRPEKYERIGARIPKGVLLVGPPGTGKTLLARAIAGEADVPFFYISASEFIELFVGLGAARVRDLFEQARQRAPAIVFIDEIDAIGQTRAGAGAGYPTGGHQEQEQTLQQLLTEMDGFAPNTGVIIVAASNRPEVLDPALLRPGRFDRQIQVNLPDIQGRRDILAIHARGVNVEPGVDLRVVARRTPGFSGAQLANVINEAALLTGRRGKDRVGRSEIEEAIDRVIAGLERRSQVLSEQERRIVAYHELGHAVVAHLVEHADPVHRVSIIPRGIGALGHTQQLPEEERYLMSEPELRDRIAVLLGGRAAEEVVFGFPTTGAEDDLRKATDIARRMVTEFGMSRKLGPINITEGHSRFLSPLARRGDDVSDHTETVIDSEIRAILSEAHEKAGQVLMQRRTELDLLADLLLDRETLERSDLEEHLGARPSVRSTREAAPDAGPAASRAAG